MAGRAFHTEVHEADFCVVGGGLAGMCAAVAAARRGARVALMHDRPMLGGNASSEIRMWVCGARGENLRETGILEELMLESYYRNPGKNYSIWDEILLSLVWAEPNVDLILNCSCLDAATANGAIRSVTGWQGTAQRYHEVRAALFADCSGDSVLAPLTGAAFRVGREARGEYGESIAPERADDRTMGMSCLIQGRQAAGPEPYVPPAWARRLDPEALSEGRRPDMGNPGENFWYLELGGDMDSIADTERIRDRLLPLAFGMWDCVKNRMGGNGDWALDWVGFLPGKRESRRYEGDVIVTESDVRSGGRFPDIVAYGGWPMDDHHPAGFETAEPPTIFHPAPSPFGLPFRALYSKNVGNLMFAGRNVSLSHAALSSARVMGTCALLGQAAGTGAAIALSRGETPRRACERRIGEIQQALMDDDCYLPGLVRDVGGLTRGARLVSDAPGAEAVRSGVDRPVGDHDNGWYGGPGSYLKYEFERPERVREVRIAFDSDLNRAGIAGPGGEVNRPTVANRPLDFLEARVPPSLVRGYELVAEVAGGGEAVIHREGESRRRAVIVPTDVIAKSIALRPLSTWGDARFRVFRFDVR